MATLNTTAKWLEYARQHKAVLTTLVAAYHPVNMDLDKWRPSPLYIAAENACQQVRHMIAEREQGEGIRPSPTVRIQLAIDDGDVGEVMALLNAAWFGVPESTGCWGLMGFKEAVELLDQPPYEDEEEMTG